MKQLVCKQTGAVSVAENDVPQLSAGDILLRVEACGVCGTDLMKVYDPTVAKPVQLGHEVSGTVAALGEGVNAFQLGQRVAAAHHAGDPQSHFTRRGSETQDPVFRATNVEPGGFSEWVRIPAFLATRTVQAVPDHVPTLRAAFMEPLACCIRALERCPVRPGDTVLVVGVGAIGILFLPLIHVAGGKSIAVDMKDDRLALAKRWGAEAALRPSDAIASACRSASEGRGADVVILTATNAATLTLALECVRDGGSIIPFGVKPGAMPAIDLWQHYRREISLIASYSATPDGLKSAMTLLSGPGFELETTISQTVPLADAPHAFAALHEARLSKVVVTPN